MTIKGGKKITVWTLLSILLPSILSGGGWAVKKIHSVDIKVVQMEQKLIAMDDKINNIYIIVQEIKQIEQQRMPRRRVGKIKASNAEVNLIQDKQVPLYGFSN